ncbi:unnamed protein product [Moneuplotes crassus]|uniref:Phospholipid scramblase n=1 Tax=Euplotes crassus TaxID=5936 RepID=A0AAD1XVW2_EUPCR|nr:unnamed protein product [Moneuplotes crassus]
MEHTKIQIETNDQYQIEQDEDIWEAYTCGFLPSESIYKIAIKSPLEGHKEVVRIFEDSQLICRSLLHPRCRAFKGQITTEDGQDLLFSYTKECGCPTMCWSRPEYDIFDHENVKIGRIKNVCKFCGMEIQILDANDDLIYTIKSSMCHWGAACEPFCGKCCALTFDIRDERKDGVITSQFKKTSRGCWKELMFNANKYELHIPPTMNYNERIMLCVGVHQLDVLWFTMKSPSIFCMHR